MDTMAPQSGEKQVFLYTENLLTISEDFGGGVPEVHRLPKNPGIQV